MVESSGAIICPWRFMFWEILKYEFNFFDVWTLQIIFNFGWVLVVCDFFLGIDLFLVRCQIYECKVVSYIPVIFLMPEVSLLILPILFLTMPIFIFSTFMFVSLISGLSILLVYLKGPRMLSPPWQKLRNFTDIEEWWNWNKRRIMIDF